MIRTLGQSRFIYFVHRQVRHIRDGGLPVLLQKARRVCRRVLNEVAFLLSIPLGLPIVLAVRALRPFVLIRFGHLSSTRIGHLAAYTEIYLCERDAGMHPPRAVDIFFLLKPVSNRYLAKMWAPWLFRHSDGGHCERKPYSLLIPKLLTTRRMGTERTSWTFI